MELYTDQDILKELGDKVSKLRKQRNTSQEELAEFCGIHRRTIILFEQGKGIKLVSFIRILRYFDLESDLMNLISIDDQIDPFKM